MQYVLMDLNPHDCPDFVGVYLDDVLVFSQSLEEHIYHFCLVIDSLMERMA